MSKPNVLLISIDTLRADHVSSYGYERATTPNLDRLAADGTRFARAFSSAVWTPPAHGSMLTGLYPTQHGVVDENKLAESVPTVAELLRNSGYRTLGVVNNSQVGPLTGLDRGHQTFHEIWKGVPARSQLHRVLRYAGRRMGELLGKNDHGAARTNATVVDWLQNNGSSKAPFYAFIHYIEPHNPLGPPRPWATRWVDPKRSNIDRAKVALVADNPLVCFTDELELTDDELHTIKALYDGEIAYLDHRLGQLFEFMKRAGVYDDTLIVVTADHGEHFGEHGLYSHVSSLYEPIVHIPLIVKFPGDKTRGVVRDALVQHVDIVPTILHLAGVAAPHADKFSGKPLDDPQAGHECVFAEWEGRVPYYVQSRLSGRTSPVCERFLQAFSMVRDAGYKYLLSESGEAALFDLQADPGEEHNVVDVQREVAGRMNEKLVAFRERVTADAPEGSRYELDPEIRKHLESLGYM